jgi:thiol:disulfide interchange protein DsbD
MVKRDDSCGPTRRAPTTGRRQRQARAAFAAALVAVAVVALPSVASAADGGSDTGAFQRALAHGAIVALAASYAFGVATSLTPCVYPMIAITVSVFGAKEAKGRLQGMVLSLTFVLGIVALFAPMGVVSALTGKGFGSALGHPWVVAGIALVFLSLSASLFGAYEIALPASLGNRLSGVGGAGYRGAFVLGLVCGLVAAPCVGPFLFGLLGWIATTRNVALGSAAMALYGLGLGTLFFVVGAFAVNLPKAGAWMMGIKWVGGVTLAYMALAYVRDALPKGTLHPWVHSGSLLGVAGGILLAAGVSLAAVHVAAERRTSSIQHLSKPAKLASVVPAIAGLFMVLTWCQTPGGVVSDALMHDASASTRAASGSLTWGASEPAARTQAASERKPLLIDFGASWCGACKELDQKTFPDPRVVAEGTRFVTLHVDATDDDDPEVGRVRQKYGVTEGLPVVLLLRSDGNEAFRFTEFVPPDRLANALAQVR